MQVEKELAQFLRLGKLKHSKFSHRMTERRLHELHGPLLSIDHARFESFHSTELQADLTPSGCSGTLCSSTHSLTTITPSLASVSDVLDMFALSIRTFVCVVCL